MKHTVFASLLLLLSIKLIAEPDTTWKRGGFASLNFNQGTFYQWAPGGQSNVAFSAIFNGYAKYNDGKKTWKNEVNLAYGTIRNFNIGAVNQVDNFWIKNEDRIQIDSKFDLKAKKQFFYSASANLLSQFDKGFIAPDFENVQSHFLAPVFVTVALGFKWKPVEYFEIFMSPAAGRYTYVRLQSLADQGLFGVAGAQKDAAGNLIAGTGQKFRPEFGASMEVNFNKKELFKNVDLATNLRLYNNYTDKNIDNRRNVDVNLTWNLLMKVSKYIGASVIGQLVYDDDILVPQKTAYELDANGLLKGRVVKSGKGIQLKNILGLGFSYKF